MENIDTNETETATTISGMKRIKEIQKNARVTRTSRTPHAYMANKKKFHDQVTFTPAEMELILTQWNRFNRKLRRSQVRNLQRDIKDGFWRNDNGNPIIFDNQGFLLSGQHRMYACLGLDIPFTTDVISGMSPDTMDVIDLAEKRKPYENPLLKECRDHDQMPDNGSFSLRSLAVSIAKNMLILERPDLGKSHSSRRLDAYYNDFKDAIESAMNGLHLKLSQDDRWMRRPGHRAAVAIYFKHAPKKAARFAKILYGSGLGITEPTILALRKKLAVSAEGGNSMYNDAKYTLLAIEAHFNGKALTSLPTPKKLRRLDITPDFFI